MFKQRVNIISFIRIIMILGFGQSVFAQEGIFFELHPDNPYATAEYNIYNDGQASISLSLQVESADSTYILYADEPDTLTYNGNIWMMRPDGTNKTELTSDTLDQGPVWSPDGAQIAFYSFRSGNADVWVMNSDGTNLVNLTNDEANDSNPHWSPDGQYIIFSSNRDDPNGEIYRMTAVGEDVQRLTFNDVQDVRPRYSPDGQHFVTQSRPPGGERDIYIYTSDGQSYVNIGIQYTSYEFQPSWTPDGKRVVWASGDHTNGELDIVSANTEGGDFRVEFGTSENDYIPRFSPDGQFLAFSKSTYYPMGGDEIFIWHKALDRLTQITDNTSVTREWGPEWSPFINAPSWLTVSPNTAQIEPGNNIGITITIDASNLPVGDHTASVMVFDTDNSNLETAVPVNLVLSTTVSLDGQVELPKTHNLSQNYPNPFNPSTMIRYSIEQSDMVQIKIYNTLGELVRTLVNEEKSTGKYTVVWDGRHEQGNFLSSGIYFYTLNIGERIVITKRMLLLK